MRKYATPLDSACRVYSHPALHFDCDSPVGRRYAEYLKSDALDGVEIAREYVSGEGMARLFRELKRRGLSDLPGRSRQVLCDLLAPAMRRFEESHSLSGEVAVVPVPGWNGLSSTLAKIISDELADRSFAARYLNALSKPSAREMKLLPWSERQHHSWRICRLERDIHTSSVVLVDDVAASGTTLSAAARMVRCAGVRNVTALLLSADLLGFSREVQSI